jgi:hypothetical protein
VSRFGTELLAKVQGQATEPAKQSKPRRTLQQIVHAAPVAVLGIDPGPSESAWVLLVDGAVADSADQDNDALLDAIRNGWPNNTHARCHAAIELIRGTGKAVAGETFTTCRYVGCFEEAARQHMPVTLVQRHEVLRHLGCFKSNGSTSDSRVRAALLMRYGKGATKGLKGHRWAAMACAVTVADRMRYDTPARQR